MLLGVAAANDGNGPARPRHRERVVYARSRGEIRSDRIERDKVQSHLTHSGDMPLLHDFDAARRAWPHVVRTDEVGVVCHDSLAAASLR